MSYDDHQRLAPLLTCVQCGRQFYVTPPREPFVCLVCKEKNDKDQARVDHSQYLDLSSHRIEEQGVIHL